MVTITFYLLLSLTPQAGGGYEATLLSKWNTHKACKEAAVSALGKGLDAACVRVVVKKGEGEEK